MEAEANVAEARAPRMRARRSDGVDGGKLASFMKTLLLFFAPRVAR
jgi:hypothetical protein